MDNENNQNQSGPKHRARPDDARPKPRRFYKDVSVKEEAGKGHAVLLDDRPIKTPMKNSLTLMHAGMATAIAKEWQDQGEFIIHETMVKTKLANTALDRVRGREDIIINEIITYAGSDLILYRATEPASLIAREQQHWDPYLAWLMESHNIKLKPATGIIHVAQEQGELNKFKDILSPYNEFALTAIHNMTSLTGSAVLAIALAKADFTLEDIWRAAHIDEDFQTERWGEDSEAKRRRELKQRDFNEAHEFLRLAGV